MTVVADAEASVARLRREVAQLHGELARNGLVIWTAVQASMIYLVLSYSSHRMLQPWCPLCSDNGGGNWKDVETPDPVPQGYQPA